MKRDELWSLYTEKNNHWLVENVTFTPAGLKSLFEQTYEQGRKEGFNNGVAIGSKAREESNGMHDFFGDIFK